MELLHAALLLSLTLTVNCQTERETGNFENEHNDRSQNSDSTFRHLVAHLTDIVDLEGQGLKHIQEHLSQKDFPKDGRFADDVQAIENGDDTKGIFYFFELHDFDKNNKLDGLELFAALTDHHDKSNMEEESKELLEQEVEYLIDNLLDEHDLNGDGYIDFTELMNSEPESLWNKLGKVNS